MDTLRDRTLNNVPSPFRADVSPYAFSRYYFDQDIRSHCDQEVITMKNNMRTSKCIFVGDIAVGKTCLINRFGNDEFINNYKATIGVDYDVQKFTILDIPMNLQIWDTAGEERLRCIASTYYRKADVAVICFDMTHLDSLTNAQRWLEEVNKSNMERKPLLFLVGTKKELLVESSYHDVQTMAATIANQLGCELWCLSSKTGENVTAFFDRVASLTFQDLIHREINLARLDPPKKVKFSNKFIKVRNNKNCKKLFSFSCARM